MPMFSDSREPQRSTKLNIFTTYLDNVLHEKEKIESSLSQKATSEADSEALGSMHHWDG